MVVGPAVALLVGLAPLPAGRAARHRRPLAPESPCLVLDQEIAAAPGKTRGGGGDSRSPTAHEPSQPLVGRTPHSWGAPQVGDCGGAIDGGWVFASSSEAALPELANVADQSSGPDRGHRLFHRVNGDLPGFVCLRRALAPSASCAASG